nr:hypothetical protein L204_05432 [Cryptococcus depauperatus CBS 7855]
MLIKSLVATSYSGIENRRDSWASVRGALDAVVSALPTQVHPSERELYLDAILTDLEPKSGALWEAWPSDLYLLALTAVKCLSRNPVGSEIALSAGHLSTIIYHANLPVEESARRTFDSSSESREALKVLANLLVLHQVGRLRFFKANGAIAVASALAQTVHEGEVIKVDGAQAETLFLLGRLGFLVVMEKPEAAKDMVDSNVIDSLVQAFMAVPMLPVNYMALSEMLKFTNALIQIYPFSDKEAEGEAWNTAFDPLLSPVLSIFYSIPTLDLGPPLTQTIHVLVSIPFLPRLLTTWKSMPELQPSPTVQYSPSSPSSAMRNLFSKLGNMASSSSPRKHSADSLFPSRARSPYPTTGSQPNLSRRSMSSSRDSPMGLFSKADQRALPARLLSILDKFMETHLPYPKKPDELSQELVLDELLPPILLLLAKAATADEAMRNWLKETLLPSTLDRSPEAGPLESRKGILGNILQLMTCGGHNQTRNSAGELMWAVCNENALDLCVEIGYGNAAVTSVAAGLSNAAVSTLRHPITSLKDTGEKTADEMTQEEKEREAEKLFVLFDRLEKNPVMRMKTGDANGDKKDVKGLKDIMKDKLDSGEIAEWERREEEEEKKNIEEEEERDESEAIRELKAYKDRMGKR